MPCASVSVETPEINLTILTVSFPAEERGTFALASFLPPISKLMRVCVYLNMYINIKPLGVSHVSTHNVSINNVYSVAIVVIVISYLILIIMYCVYQLLYNLYKYYMMVMMSIMKIAMCLRLLCFFLL